MAVIGTFTKQPGEDQDYDLDFTPYLTYHGDAALSYTAAIEPGATITSTSMLNGVVKVWVSGGTDGVKYKVTVKMTTTNVPPRRKEAEIIIKVKET